MNRVCLLLLLLLLLLFAGTLCPQELTVVAFDHFGNGIASTWAANHTVGTPAVVTWGFMLDGTVPDPALRLDPIKFADRTGLVGSSNIGSLRHRIDVVQGHGAGAFDAALQRAMAT